MPPRFIRSPGARRTRAAFELGWVAWIDQLVPLRPGSFGHPGRLKSRVTHQVLDDESAREQVIGDDAPVASPPERFGTHDRAASHAAQLEKATEPDFERLGKRIVGIIVEAAILPEAVHMRCHQPGGGSQAAEFGDSFVTDPMRRQLVGQDIKIVLRIGARTRHASNVDYHVYSPSAEQRHESLDRSGRVTDGEDRRKRGLVHAAHQYLWSARSSPRPSRLASTNSQLTRLPSSLAA